MIQSGTGELTGRGELINLNIKSKGKTCTTCTINFTVTFPKAFNNPPVVIINTNGVAFDLSATAMAPKDQGLVAAAILKWYKLTSTSTSKTEFTASLELETMINLIDFPFTKTGFLFGFSWLAYDEVTIGA